MCQKEIGLYVQNIITIIGPIVDRFGEDLCDHLLSMKSSFR